jgi:hypothetical protein
MKFPTVRSFCIAIALAGAAFAKAPTELPIGASNAPVEPPIVFPNGTPTIEGEEMEGEDDSNISGSLVPGEISPAAGRIIEFQGDEIGLVLRTLARQARINLVVSNKVANAGTVTMRLDDLTPREAIDVIVQDKGLFMAEIDGVYFIKTYGEAAKEPAHSALGRMTDTIVGPLATLKGKYYRQLVESGVPETTAATIVLNEELSKGAFANGATESQSTPTESNPSRSVPDWFTWTFIGSTVVEVLQRVPFLLLHFILAIAVWATARRAQRSGTVLTYFSPFFWGFATLIGGVLVAGLYWVIHHSSLRLSGERAA